MSYREYVPSPVLRDYVDCYWHYITGHPMNGEQLPVQRCLPLGTVEIIAQVDGNPSEILDEQQQLWEKTCRVYFTGMYTDTVIWRAQPGTLMFGIRLKPEALMKLFRTPPSLLLNNVVDAEAVIGPAAKVLYDQICGVFDTGALVSMAERYLLDRLAAVAHQRNYVAEACKLIRVTNGDITIEELSESIYVSRRQLERSFKTEFGASPKTYQRIIRFRNAYRYARRHNKIHWADVSYESGYADQAHFIRDFKAFTGDVPSVLIDHQHSFFQTLDVVTD